MGHGLVLQGHVPCRNFVTVGYRFPSGPPPGIAKSGHLGLFKIRSPREKEIVSWPGKEFSSRYKFEEMSQNEY